MDYLKTKILGILSILIGGFGLYLGFNSGYSMGIIFLGILILLGARQMTRKLVLRRSFNP